MDGVEYRQAGDSRKEQPVENGEGLAGESA
jgi:hypothetical protein